MLWNYAPLETMDCSLGLPRRVCGPGGGGIQMDRLRRGGPLLRSAGARCREDRHAAAVRSLERVTTRQAPPAPSADQTKPLGVLGYSAFALTSPTPEQSFFGDQTISAHLSLEPALLPGHTVTWHLDGGANRGSGSDGDGRDLAPSGPGHVRDFRDGHESGHGRVTAAPTA